MIKQTSLHLKLNSDLLQRLDYVCSVANINRNKAVNMMLLVLVRRCEFELWTSNNKSVHFFKSYESYFNKLING